MTKRSTFPARPARRRRSRMAQDEMNMAMFIAGMSILVIIIMATLFVVSDGFSVNLLYGKG